MAPKTAEAPPDETSNTGPTMDEMSGQYPPMRRRDDFFQIPRWVLWLVLGGGTVTGVGAGSVGVDLLGVQALRSEVAKLEGKVSGLERKAADLDHVDAVAGSVLDDIQWNIKQLCTATGATCKE